MWCMEWLSRREIHGVSPMLLKKLVIKRSKKNTKIRAIWQTAGSS